MRARRRQAQEHQQPQDHITSPIWRYFSRACDVWTVACCTRGGRVSNSNRSERLPQNMDAEAPRENTEMQNFGHQHNPTSHHTLSRATGDGAILQSYMVLPSDQGASESNIGQDGGTNGLLAPLDRRNLSVSTIEPSDRGSINTSNRSHINVLEPAY